MNHPKGRNVFETFVLAVGAVAIGNWLWRWLQTPRTCNLCDQQIVEPPGPNHQMTHPLWNVREICKQLILAEQHFFNPRERCAQCQRKHLIHIEALADEAITLDGKNAYGFLRDLPMKVRQISKSFATGCDQVQVGQALRALRKDLLPKCFYIAADPADDKTLQER